MFGVLNEIARETMSTVGFKHLRIKFEIRKIGEGESFQTILIKDLKYEAPCGKDKVGGVEILR